MFHCGPSSWSNLQSVVSSVTQHAQVGLWSHSHSAHSSSSSFLPLLLWFGVALVVDVALLLLLLPHVCTIDSVEGLWSHSVSVQ